jgi:beta-glucoside operon transcriptional antiterminator
MQINKVVNNNFVIVIDDNNREQVVMGLGIGFQKKRNDYLDPEKIEKVFSLSNDDAISRLSELLSQIPPEVMACCELIIKNATEKLGKLQDNIYITLTDHCHFAFERHKKGIFIRNVLLWEIKRLYPKEFEVGQEALNIIEQRLNIKMAEDEAGFIALHLVTAQLGNDVPQVMYITQVIQEILDIIKFQLNVTYEENSLDYQRFVTHLKFFAQRIHDKLTLQDDDIDLYSAIKENYVKAWCCAEVVGNHLKKHYKHQLSNDEIMFLAIHIERIRKNTK